jgi:hypothetical protein
VSLAAEGRLTDPERFRGNPVAAAGRRWCGSRRERDRLQSAYVAERRDWSPAKRRANRQQVRMLDRALSDPHAIYRVDRIMRAADDYKAASDTARAEADRAEGARSAAGQGGEAADVRDLGDGRQACGGRRPGPGRGHHLTASAIEKHIQRQRA